MSSEKTLEAVLIVVGSELVTGASQDTNSRFAAQLLGMCGVRVRRMAVVRDDLGDLERVLKKALQDAEIVLTSGGLGPTEDDVTREALARSVGRELVHHEELVEAIQARFAARGREMPVSNRRQASLPEGAEALINNAGTAPGVWLARGNRVLIALPGVPHEFCHMLEEAVIPRLMETYAAELAPERHRCLLTTGVSESRLGERVAHLMELGREVELGITAEMGASTLRLVGRGPDEAAVGAALDAVEAELRELLGPDVCSGYPGSPEDAVAALPGLEGVAVVDGVTGGVLSGRLADAGVRVAAWAGDRDFLEGCFASLGKGFGAVEAAAAGAAMAGLGAGLAILPGEEDFLFLGATLGEEAREAVVVPSENPDVNRLRCVGRAMDLLRRMASGLPSAEEADELQALASLGDTVAKAADAALDELDELEAAVADEVAEIESQAELEGAAKGE